MTVFWRKILMKCIQKCVHGKRFFFLEKKKAFRKKPQFCGMSQKSINLNKLMWSKPFFSIMVITFTCGKDAIKLWIFAIFAASTTSSIETDLSLSPYMMFSAMVRSNKIGSCETMPNWLRINGTLSPSILWPSKD